MNLGSLLETAYRGIHDEVFDGVATGGSTTTIVDTAIVGKYVDNKFKNWVAFDSATNQYSVISGNVNSTGVITFAPAIATAVVATDNYSIVKGSIPLYTLIKLCNDALKQLGKMWLIDTSLSTAANTRNYATPIAAKGERFRDLYLMDTNNYRYPAPNYDILPAVGGSIGTLQFKGQPSVSKTIVIEYNGAHTALSSYSSTVNETIDDRLITASVIERAYYWKMLPKRKKIDADNWMMAKGLLGEAKSLFPIQRKPLHVQRLPIDVFN